MLARIKTCAVTGIDAAPVDVEVFVKGGPSKFIIIGLGDSAVRESRDRVYSAIRHSGFEMPGSGSITGGTLSAIVLNAFFNEIGRKKVEKLSDKAA